LKVTQRNNNKVITRWDSETWHFAAWLSYNSTFTPMAIIDTSGLPYSTDPYYVASPGKYSGIRME